MTTPTVVPSQTFRDATSADVPRLCEMFQRFHDESHYALHAPVSLPRFTALVEGLIASEEGKVLVVESDDTLVGMIGLIVIDHPMSGDRCASDLFWWLEPEHRGQGAGVRLLQAAEAWAVTKGARRILMISPQSQMVDRLYEKLGYVPIETTWHKTLDWFSEPVVVEHIVQHHPHGIVVHDNVLSAPLAHRALALRQSFEQVHDGAATFQRIALCMDSTVQEWIKNTYPQLTPRLSVFRQGAEWQVEPNFVHTDVSMGDWTGILYLTPNPPVEDGTSFWRNTSTEQVWSTKTGVDEVALWHDETAWIHWLTVRARFNRLVLFPSQLYHSRAIRENYGHGDEARLIQAVWGTGRL